MMRAEPQVLPGVHLLIPEPHRDERGFFARVFDSAVLGAAGLVTEFPQWSLAFNARRGTLRGLHWQAAPHAEVKIVQCVRGAVFDVVVDIRRDSPSFGKWLGFPLNCENRHLLYVPKGFAHGMLTLRDDTEIYYHISTPFAAESARGVRWNDPDLGITWPHSEGLVMSDRDAQLPTLREIEPV